MLADDPSDTFLRYSLAMELDKEGEHDASLAKFAELTNDIPPYVPAYFMAAQQLVRLARTAEACEILRSGIDAAKPTGFSRRGRNDRVSRVARWLITGGQFVDAAVGRSCEPNDCRFVPQAVATAHDDKTHSRLGLWLPRCRSPGRSLR